VGQHAAAERDAAVLLRGFEEAVRNARASDASNRRAFLDLLERVLRDTEKASPAAAPEPPPSRLIVP
jgi:hypothetical protein